MRKNKILLVNPPHVVLKRKNESYSSLGLGYMSSFLKVSGFQVTILNADWMSYNFFKKPTTYEISLNDFSYSKLGENYWPQIKHIISKISPDILGLSISTPAYNSALKIAKIAKETNPNIIVIAGGIHPSVMPAETLRESAFDIVVMGEGEHTMLDLAKCLPDKEGLYNIPGICFKNEIGEVIFNKERGFIKNLDSLYFPDRTFLSLDGKIRIDKKASIIASRGCCFRCSFCSRRSVSGSRVRYRSAENIVEEIVYLNKKHGIDRFTFVDSTFGVDNFQAREICHKLLTKSIKILWECQTRAGILDANIVNLMRKSGCFAISIGVESGNADILRKIKKDISIDKILETAAIIKKARIKLGCNFIVGYKEETEKSLLDTQKLIDKIRPDGLSVSLLVPYPGSEIFREFDKENRLKTYDWSLYTAENSDLFTRDNISHEKLILYREKLLREFFIKVRFKKLFSIERLMIEMFEDIKHPGLLVEKIKKFVYLSYTFLLRRS